VSATNPGFYRRQIGDMTVTAIFDGLVEIPLDAVTGIALDEARRLQDRDLRPYPPMLPTAFFAVTQGEDTILIDAGGAPQLDAGLGLGRANLLAAGIDPLRVGSVLLTHLHSDHYGGLTLPDATAAFPNAELILHSVEHACRFATAETPPDYLQRAVAPYSERLRLIEDDPVLPGIDAVFLPGHTPGHTGWRLRSDGQQLLVWGDVVHLPSIQFRHPAVSMSYDTDREQSAASRQHVFTEALRDNTLVAGMHLDFPCFGHVTQADAGYRWVPEPFRHTP
jgi:glyoxylase-like metal-dependent hydrolase (beta-lactamase superfamily II)